MKRGAMEKAFRKMFNVSSFSKKQYDQVFANFKRALLINKLAKRDGEDIERWRKKVYKEV